MKAPQGNARARVLFVDDEPAVLEGMRNNFRRHPYDVLTANSAAEALRMLELTEVQVVVSDERMPGMQGSELMAVVCERYPETIRIILTGQASLDAAIRAVNEGEIFRFLLKPCNPADLAQTIQTALQFWELRRQTSRLLAETRQRGRTLRDLEQHHPGITRVTRGADGTIEVDDELMPVEDLLGEIQKELSEPRSAGEDETSDGTRRAS